MNQIKDYLKANAKRLGIGLATLAIVIAGAAAFSAFEAHIINVTARIENALQVDTTPIKFGTVFPQEYITSDVRIVLSDSFLGEDRVDDINYVIKQKPKVKTFVAIGDPNANPVPGDPYATIQPTTHQSGIVAWRYCEENLPVNAPYGLDETELQAEYWRYCYLPLANYLSKHENTEDGDEIDNDTSVDAFHQAYQWVGGVSLPSSLNPDFIAGGLLVRSAGDTVDSWTIDLMVPCFVNQCAQEADDESNLVNDGTPGFFVPLAFRLPTSTEHAVFGTDLWIEVTGVSESGDQLIVSGSDDFTMGNNAPFVNSVLESTPTAITTYQYGLNTTWSGDALISTVQWKITVDGPDDLDVGDVHIDELGWEDISPASSTVTFHYPMEDTPADLMAVGSCALPDPVHSDACAVDDFDVDPNDDFNNVNSIHFSENAPLGTYQIKHVLVDTESDTALSNEFVVTVELVN